MAPTSRWRHGRISFFDGTSCWRLTVLRLDDVGGAPGARSATNSGKESVSPGWSDGAALSVSRQVFQPKIGQLPVLGHTVPTETVPESLNFEESAMKKTRRLATEPRYYTDDDLRAYAHHLWIQGGMSFDRDPWGEAKACLEANLPPAEPRVRFRRQLQSGGTRARPGDPIVIVDLETVERKPAE